MTSPLKPNASRRRGFSLIEVLAVVVISAFILQGLAQITGSLLRKWGETNHQLGDFALMTNTVETIAKEVEGIIPLTVQDGERQNAFFRGEATRMEFVRPAIGFENTADLNHVVYAIERNGDHTNVVRYSGILAATKPVLDTTTATRTILAEFDGNVRFEFSSDAIGFRTDWINQVALPTAVRISFALDGMPDREFSKLASPVTDGTIACLIDTQRPACDAYLAVRR